jgi:transcriptional regulator with XRE-family HTH domain
MPTINQLVKKPQKRQGVAILEDVHFSGAGAVIRIFREERQLTLEALAKKVGVNKSTLHRYETNDAPLSDGMIERLAKAMAVKPTSLMHECLMHLRPKLKNSPFGQLLRELVN